MNHLHHEKNLLRVESLIFLFFFFTPNQPYFCFMMYYLTVFSWYMYHSFPFRKENGVISTVVLCYVMYKCLLIICLIFKIMCSYWAQREAKLLWDINKSDNISHQNNSSRPQYGDKECELLGQELPQ